MKLKEPSVIWAASAFAFFFALFGWAFFGDFEWWSEKLSRGSNERTKNKCFVTRRTFTIEKINSIPANMLILKTLQISQLTSPYVSRKYICNKICLWRCSAKKFHCTQVFNKFKKIKWFYKIQRSILLKFGILSQKSI